MGFGNEVEERLRQQIADLQDGVNREVGYRAGFVKEIEASKERQRRMERAINALAGEVGKVRQEPSKAGKRKSVSPALQERVVLALEEHGPATAMDISKVVGVSDASVYTAFAMLREQGRIRLAGVGPKAAANSMQPKLFAVMPSVSANA